MNLLPSWSSQAEHAIFVTQEGDILVWGNNEDGTLGVPTPTENMNTPIPLHFPEGEGGGRGGGRRGRTEIEALACGQRHSLALMSDGRLFGWGRGTYQQLGAEKREYCEPTLLVLPERPVFLACGTNVSAAIMEGGTLFMGGKNDHGELGEEGQETMPFPKRVPSLPPIVEVNAGWFHVLARTEEGEVYSWGRNDSGEAGQGGDTFSLSTPTLLPFPEKITKVLCGAYHSLFLGETGTLFSCGWNFYGNTGLGSGERPFTPEAISFGEGGGRVKEVATGWAHSMVLLEDGTLRVWGCNSFEQLGLGSGVPNAHTPVLLPFPPREEGGGEGNEERDEEGDEVMGIGCSGDNSHVVTKKGDLWTWGRGAYGVPGHGHDNNVMVPRRVEGLRVRLPKSRSQWWWEEVGAWLFLGRVDGDSQFWGMPLEVVFHFVKATF